MKIALVMILANVLVLMFISFMIPPIPVWFGGVIGIVVFLMNLIGVVVLGITVSHKIQRSVMLIGLMVQVRNVILMEIGVVEHSTMVCLVV